MQSVVVEAERVALGAALTDPAHVDAVLAVRSWSLPAHAALAVAIKNSANRGLPVTVPTVRAILTELGAVDAAGGAGYLTVCVEAAAAVPPGSLPQFINLVHRAAADRAEADAAARLAVALSNGDPVAAAKCRDEMRQAASMRRDDSIDRWHAALDQVGVPVRGGIKLTTPGLDAYWGVLWPGQLAIVAGRTSVGKTALCTTMALSLASSDVRVHVLSLEDTEHEWAERMVAALSTTAIADLRAGVADPAKIRTANEYLRSLPLSVEHHAGDDADRVGLAVANAVTAGARVVIIDYVQAISWGRDGSEYAMLQHALGVIEHALGDRACAILGSQLSRGEAHGATTSMHMLRGSGALEERARKVLLLHRQKANDKVIQFGDLQMQLDAVDVEFAKNKGPVGIVRGAVWADFAVWCVADGTPVWQRAPMKEEFDETAPSA